jgi:hypothetical protein
MSDPDPGPLPSLPPSPAPRERRTGCGGACLSALTVLLLLAAVGVVATFFGPPMIADYLRYRASRFGEEFVKRNIQESFREETLRVASTRGNILELATKVSEETFDRSTQLVVGGIKVPFFDNTATLKTRATFRYHLKLDGAWQLREETGDGRTLIVISPRIEATLPVAFDSEAMESQLRGYWIARHQQGESLDQLRTTLTQRLEQRAVSPESIDSVREPCRQSVALFVKQWLLREDQWQAEGFTAIKVLFPDEEQKDTDRLPPTLRLDELSPAS